MAAKNITSLVEAREAGKNMPQLEDYKPTKPMVSLSLGLHHSIKQMVGPDSNFVVTEHSGEEVDSHWQQMWSALGLKSDDPFI